MNLFSTKKVKQAFIVLTVLLSSVIAFAKEPVKVLTGNFDFKISINQADTANIATIEVKLGSTDGSSNLLSYNFTYDQKTGLPTGLAYSRRGMEINLTLGNYVVGAPMFGEYKIINKNGQVALTKKFQYR